ncbi:hypothetical protein GCM10010345_69590 [Streptomyces canarius]|uniref:Uncharacterized protein n=1 Tax=Streptomyces canarius TaxID=285453 RepID=A0ABQ3D300_9ACTN|nr:hypothetical protein GCM10010345_69590 [Streptomyces canarius]
MFSFHVHTARVSVISGLSGRESTPGPAHRADVSAATVSADPPCTAERDAKWLVGLQFFTGDRRCVWLYYVMDGALQAAEAACEGVRRAGSELMDQSARSGIEFAGGRIELRRIRQDAIGRFVLVPSR